MTSDDRSPGRRAASTAARVAAEVLAWTLAAWGIWLVSLTAVSAEDLGVGGGCALVCGVLGASARRLVQGRGRPTLDILRPALLLPLAVVADTLTVLAEPWRPSRRRARAGEGRRPLTSVDTGASGDALAARARRSFATIASSASPG
ncbi:MAG: hypothetical protein ACRDYZ_08345, partial [Acidimicrobiales bacterium]